MVKAFFKWRENCRIFSFLLEDKANTEKLANQNNKKDASWSSKIFFFPLGFLSNYLKEIKPSNQDKIITL
jgi:hypothetical protein